MSAVNHICLQKICSATSLTTVQLQLINTSSFKIMVTLLKEILGEKFVGNSCLILILIVSCVFKLWCVNQMKPSVGKITF